jgi:hypothetical protein
MNKIYIDRFVCNNPNKKLEDFIQNIRMGVRKGILNVYFSTTDKYYDVDARMSVHTDSYIGQGVEIRPYITGEDGSDLAETDYEAYVNHPEYFYICLVVEGFSGCQAIVTPLKHEYFVSYIDNDDVMNYGCLESVEVVCGEDAGVSYE